MSKISVIFTTFFLAFSTLSLFPSALSSPTTTFFHVSAITRQAQKPLSFPHNKKTHTIPFNSSSLFSLPLHPRPSLQKPPYKNYKSLLQSRLARDAVRVKFLNRNLELALNLNPDLRPEDLSVPVTPGKSQGSGEYFARISIGQPAKSYYWVVDTGSDINWLQCLPCQQKQSCYEQADPIFDPSSSSSYNPLSCDSPQCQSLSRSGCDQDNNKCLYQVLYGDGSFTTGELATETLSFGNSDSFSNVAIGCGHDNEGLFMGSAGLIGLGGGPLSLASQLKLSSFSYCLTDRDSDSPSTLEFNSVQLSDDSITAQLLKNDRFSAYRYVEMTGLSVGGIPVSIPKSTFDIDESGLGGVIVDSGTVITRLQTQVYESLRDSFLNLTRHLPPAGKVLLFDTCYDLSSMTDVQVPTVAIQFTGGKSLRLPANNYLIRVDSAGTFCFAFAATSSSLSIIGNFQQQGIRVSYDLANSVVGFSSNQC